MYKFVLILSGAFWLQVGLSSAAPVVVADSTGIENRNGKAYVVHEVEPKETVYALSRKYKVPVTLILEANPTIDGGITIGQIVYIPRKAVPKPASPKSTAATAKAAPAAKKPTTSATPASREIASTSRTYTVDAQGQKIHVVEPKQTLFSLSRMYQVSPEEIRRWNNLSSNNINIGASLIVGKNQVATKAPMYIPEPDDAANAPKASVPEQAVAMASDKTQVPKAEPVREASPTPEVKVVPEREVVRTEPGKVEKVVEAEEAPAIRSSDTAGKVIETGLAEVIDQKGDVNKYLALHKTAPVGTILQVKNIMNGQTVFVRVIGTLPPTGSNEKVIVKVSKKAYQKLAALDNRFRVELSYMP